MEADPEGTARRLVTGDPTGLLVLRDIDRWSATTVRTVTAALDTADTAIPILVATGSEVMPCHAHQDLLTHFRASVTVPALRHRGADLPAVALSVLTDLAPHRDIRISPAALRVLRQFPWPGNVRQLEQALSVAMTRRPVGLIEDHDLPEFCQSESSRVDAPRRRGRARCEAPRVWWRL